MEATKSDGDSWARHAAGWLCMVGLAVHHLALAEQAPGPSQVAKLETPNYLIRIEVNCPEGEVACDRVTYTGKSKKTGRELTLLGRTVHTLCADGVTPCRFVGYQFRNGTTTYVVTEEGELIVRDGGKVIIDERGSLD